MNIISPRTNEMVYDYHHEFSTNRRGSFYSFDCDEQGNLLDESHADRLAQAMSGEIDGMVVQYRGIKVFRRYEVTPAVGECECCGAEVVLEHFTNTCDCGADYNMEGRRLAPRSQWGEETGEPWYECY